ncbi:MAG: cation-translocating P-type ATPase, partial [Deltaproteobacteria bacterium]
MSPARLIDSSVRPVPGGGGGVAPPPHTLSPESALHALGVDERSGLSARQVAERHEKYGPNELAAAREQPLWRKFLGQFNDLVIWILIVAALISGVLGEWTDATAIIAIVLLNAVLGFVQEEKAERALAALQKLAAPLARVLRDGRLQSLPARELVPGDVLDLDAGDNVPADARLLEAFGVRVQESALTGESVPVDKDANCILAKTVPLGDRRNMAYLGTVVAGGKARAVVVHTGMRTELGRIAGMLQAYETEPTPLQRKLARLGKVLVVICLVLVAVIFAMEMWRGDSLIRAFLLSVSLAVAAVPEGLPAVVTVSLALGLQRMVRRNALIRKLPSVETLGSVTVICSDKTGTLTRNEMTVREILTGSRHYQVTGSGYAPHGEFRSRCAEGGDVAVDPSADPELPLLLTIASRCNHTEVVPAGDGENIWKVVGDPTEGALVVAALKARLQPQDQGEHVLYEIPFDSERKAMSVVLPHGAGGAIMYTKGAPEEILSRCSAEHRDGETIPLTDSRRREIIEANADMASRALRVLAFAYRDWASAPEHFTERDLVFVGLAGMIDPPREEVKQSVATCRAAGIRPVMITGDHPATARAIARELGIAAPTDTIIIGHDLDAMSDQELAEQVEQIVVYARVTAEHKLRVVRAWKSRGEVVAMTGDGVNDAPAVKSADIGIAMGASGTDVTREASAMILMDDNFTSIVSAVEEGRAIYDNIQKFLTYLLSCNIGEMLLMLAASLLGWPAPLQPVQLLWINLVTDGLPALALGLEPPEPGVM